MGGGDQQFYESPQEMDKMRRRAEIRQRLKAEFNRLHYNPYKLAAHVEILDPAVQRFMAMKASVYQYWKPTWGSFALFFVSAPLPIFLYGYYLNQTRNSFDKKCRSGEIPVEKRPFLI